MFTKTAPPPNGKAIGYWQGSGRLLAVPKLDLKVAVGSPNFTNEHAEA